jgi:hypothetical protein
VPGCGWPRRVGLGRCGRPGGWRRTATVSARNVSTTPRSEPVSIARSSWTVCALTARDTRVRRFLRSRNPTNITALGQPPRCGSRITLAVTGGQIAVRRCSPNPERRGKCAHGRLQDRSGLRPSNLDHRPCAPAHPPRPIPNAPRSTSTSGEPEKVQQISPNSSGPRGTPSVEDF